MPLAGQTLHIPPPPPAPTLQCHIPPPGPNPTVGGVQFKPVSPRQNGPKIDGQIVEQGAG